MGVVGSSWKGLEDPLCTVPHLSQGFLGSSSVQTPVTYWEDIPEGPMRCKLWLSFSQL